tara:strand:+ start:922 stop:1128 length:207 start_codon:yes stop_codon:yes gene_type:complete
MILAHIHEYLSLSLQSYAKRLMTRNILIWDEFWASSHCSFDAGKLHKYNQNAKEQGFELAAAKMHSSC